MDIKELLKSIEPKSDQLNADDLLTGSRTVTISKVSGGNKEQPVVINYDGDNGKPYKPCKSMRRVLIAIWGEDAREWISRSMTLYADPDVVFGGVKVGGIRISHMSNIAQAKTLALTASKAQRKPFTVKPLVIEETTKTVAPVDKNKKAEEAAQKIISEINACWDLSEADAIKERNSKIIARFVADYPDLSKQIDDAYNGIAAQETGEVIEANTEAAQSTLEGSEGSPDAQEGLPHAQTPTLDDLKLLRHGTAEDADIKARAILSLLESGVSKIDIIGKIGAGFEVTLSKATDAELVKKIRSF